MGLKKNTSWARAKAAGRQGVRRKHRKFEPRRMERIFEMHRQKQLLGSFNENAAADVDALEKEVPRRLLPSPQQLAARKEVEARRAALFGSSTEQPRRRSGYGRGEAYTYSAETFYERIGEKMLDAVEPLWFAKHEQLSADAVARAILEKKTGRRIRKQVALKVVEAHPIHPLYQIIEPRMPEPAVIERQPKPVGPKVVQAAFAEKDIRNLLLFKGGMSLARARAMFVFLSACMDAGKETVADIVKASRAQALTRSVSDLAHVSGLHSVLDNLSLYGFLARIRQTASVWPLAPGIKEWAMEVRGQLRIVLSTVPRYATRARKSTRAWRISARTEVAEFYPYIVEAPTDECALVLKVHEAVPKHLPNELRADVCQEILVDILSGNMTVESLGSPDFGRLMHEKLKQIRGRFTWSLEEPAYRERAKSHSKIPTRGELLANDIQHW